MHSTAREKEKKKKNPSSSSAPSSSSSSTVLSPVPLATRLQQSHLWRRRLERRRARPHALPRPLAPPFLIEEPQALLLHLLREQIPPSNPASNDEKLQSAQEDLRAVLALPQEFAHRQVAQLHQWQQTYAPPILLHAVLALTSSPSSPDANAAPLQ